MLHSQGAEEGLQPASITKITVALVIFRLADAEPGLLAQEITVSSDAASVSDGTAPSGKQASPRGGFTPGSGVCERCFSLAPCSPAHIAL